MSRAIIIVDLGFGDSGKGTFVDWLCRVIQPGPTPTYVVRYNGGAQAYHNVVTDDGRHHGFHQFGSGTLAGARTHLGPGMLVNPVLLAKEAADLAMLDVLQPWNLITIDERALITNPFHVAANRLRELARTGGRHGSCGLGINETVTDALAMGDDAVRAGDLLDPGVLHDKLLKSWERNVVKMAPVYASAPRHDAVEREWQVLSDRNLVDNIARKFLAVGSWARVVPSDWFRCEIIPQDVDIVFEGAQGVLLDEFYGFFPHVTRSITTTAGALAMLPPSGVFVERWGMVRTYTTRHGAGPLPTEDRDQGFPEPHNASDDPWQQGFRQGPLDLPLIRYALKATGGVDCLAVTHLDVGAHRLCRRYEDESFLEGLPEDIPQQEARMRELSRAVPVIEEGDVLEALNELAPVIATSHGPRPGDKRWLRREAAHA